MLPYRLERCVEVPEDLETVFTFFSRPENLESLTPSHVGFRILTPSPIPMHVGSVIDYTVRLAGIPIRWTSQISELSAPHRFVDVQLRGPYSFWHHAHEFESTDGGTRIRDVVTYGLPAGPLGRLVHALFVRRQLTGIFDHREHAILTKFDGSFQNAG